VSRLPVLLASHARRPAVDRATQHRRNCCSASVHCKQQLKLASTTPNLPAKPSLLTQPTPPRLCSPPKNCWLSNMNSNCDGATSGQRRMCCCGASACPASVPISPLGWQLGGTAQSCTDVCPPSQFNFGLMNALTTPETFTPFWLTLSSSIRASPLVFRSGAVFDQADPSISGTHCRHGGSALIGILDSAVRRHLCRCLTRGCGLATASITTTTTTTTTTQLLYSAPQLE
jgi:hypothetical protein